VALRSELERTYSIDEGAASGDRPRLVAASCRLRTNPALATVGSHRLVMLRTRACNRLLKVASLDSAISWGRSANLPGRTPGWYRLRPVPPQPSSACDPAHWDYQNIIRPLTIVDQSGRNLRTARSQRESRPLWKIYPPRAEPLSNQRHTQTCLVRCREGLAGCPRRVGRDPLALTPLKVDTSPTAIRLQPTGGSSWQSNRKAVSAMSL
jgi:hypothetical protein